LSTKIEFLPEKKNRILKKIKIVLPEIEFLPEQTYSGRNNFFSVVFISSESFLSVK